jgi:hypothetical protein
VSRDVAAGAPSPSTWEEFVDTNSEWLFSPDTAKANFQRGDNVIVTRPDTHISGQMGRVFSIQDQGTTVDVDFPIGGLLRIPAADLTKAPTT